MPRETVIDEIEWWDRVAMAVDMLLKRSGAQRRKFLAGETRVEWIGNDASLFSGRETISDGAPDLTAYVFSGVQDVEILRRLNQMPDETPLDLLAQPFSLYCPEMNSFVSINNSSVSLEEHVAKMKGQTL
jgi:hypothetical protein